MLKITMVAAGLSVGYNCAVQAKTILIDGQKAVPIPAAVLEQCPLGDVVDVSVVPGGVLVKSASRKPREGWAEAMEKIPQEELDRDYEELRAFRETRNEWDEKEWHWPESTPDEKV